MTDFELEIFQVIQIFCMHMLLLNRCILTWQDLVNK